MALYDRSYTTSCIFGLNVNICTEFGGKMHHSHLEMTTWPKNRNLK